MDDVWITDKPRLRQGRGRPSQRAVLVDEEGVLTGCCEAYTSVFIDGEVEHRKCCDRPVTGFLGNAVFDMPVRYKLPP